MGIGPAAGARSTPATGRLSAVTIYETPSTPPTQELAVAIKQAVGALAEADRDVFLLRESAGLSYDEIAVACDLTTEAVRARLKRAREQLRHTLDGPMRVGRQGAIAFRRTEPGEGS